MSSKHKPKTGKHQGSVFQRSDGKWVSQVSVGYDQYGRRKRQTLYSATKEEAEKKLSLLSDGYGAGVVDDPHTINVAAFMEQRFENMLKNGKLRITTFHMYRGVAKKHIYPYIGGSVVSKLTEGQMRSYFAALERAGVTPFMQHRSYRILFEMCKNAVEIKILTQNPMLEIPAPLTPEREMTVFTPEQIIQFLNAAKNTYFEAAYYIAICGGLRIGEIFGLKWQDINWEKKTIAVQRQMIEVGPERMPTLTNDLKSKSSRRVVMLPDIAMEALRRHKVKMEAAFYSGELLFVSVNFKPMRQANFTNQHFKPLLKRASVPLLRFHDLRHSHGTLMFLLDTHPKVVQERLGHSTIDITMDVYSHVLPTIQRAAVDKLDKFFTEHGGALLQEND